MTHSVHHGDDLIQQRHVIATYQRHPAVQYSSAPISCVMPLLFAIPEEAG